MKKFICTIIVGFLLTGSFFLVSCDNNLSKIKNLKMGDSIATVKEILGDPTAEDGSSWEYFGENFIRILEKLEKVTKKADKAYEDKRLDLVEKLYEEIESLETKLSTIETEYIKIIFDKTGKLQSLLYDKNYNGTNGEAKSTYDNPATIIVESFTDTTASVRIEYPDGSYRIQKITDVSIKNHGAIAGVDEYDILTFNYVDEWGSYYNKRSTTITKLIVENGTTRDEIKRTFKNEDKWNDVQEIWFNGTVSEWCKTFYDMPTTGGMKVYFNDKVLDGDVVIENGVKKIPTGTFSCKNITSVTLPNTLTVLDEWVFNRCNMLSSVTIGTGIKKLSKETFYYCSNLTEIKYTGTCEQWNNIIKEANWIQGLIKTTYVQCSDGIVNL